mgnify:CR=1 FL=1
MKIGLSSYSLDPLIRSGQMSLEQAIDWAAKNGAEVMELVPFAFRFDDPSTGAIDKDMIARVRRRAKDAGIELVNYSVLADLLKQGEDRQACQGQHRDLAQGIEATEIHQDDIDHVRATPTRHAVLQEEPGDARVGPGEDGPGQEAHAQAGEDREEGIPPPARRDRKSVV